jgi:hypothetical protein
MRAGNAMYVLASSTPEVLRNHIASRALNAVGPQSMPAMRGWATLAGAMRMGLACRRYLLRMADLRDADIKDILG